MFEPKLLIHSNAKIQHLLNVKKMANRNQDDPVIFSALAAPSCCSFYQKATIWRKASILHIYKTLILFQHECIGKHLIRSEQKNLNNYILIITGSEHVSTKNHQSPAWTLLL